jgi:hypothetical protein
MICHAAVSLAVLGLQVLHRQALVKDRDVIEVDTWGMDCYTRRNVFDAVLEANVFKHVRTQAQLKQHKQQQQQQQLTQQTIKSEEGAAVEQSQDGHSKQPELHQQDSGPRTPVRRAEQTASAVGAEGPGSMAATTTAAAATAAATRATLAGQQAGITSPQQQHKRLQQEQQQQQQQQQAEDQPPGQSPGTAEKIGHDHQHKGDEEGEPGQDQPSKRDLKRPAHPDDDAIEEQVKALPGLVSTPLLPAYGAITCTTVLLSCGCWFICAAAEPCLNGCRLLALLALLLPLILRKPRPRNNLDLSGRQKMMQCTSKYEVSLDSRYCV